MKLNNIHENNRLDSLPHRKGHYGTTIIDIKSIFADYLDLWTGRDKKRVPTIVAEGYTKYHGLTPEALMAAGYPIQEVPFNKTVATQPTITTEPPQTPGSPHTIHYQGVYYLCNGHHRAITEWANGKDTFRTYVIDLSAGDG